ncbi:hypothetical protein [Marinobacter changyiensis]|nr:hypothetical protein [Marinobacter changyiensis]
MIVFDSGIVQPAATSVMVKVAAALPERSTYSTIIEALSPGLRVAV